MSDRSARSIRSALLFRSGAPPVGVSLRLKETTKSAVSLRVFAIQFSETEPTSNRQPPRRCSRRGGRPFTSARFSCQAAFSSAARPPLSTNRVVQGPGLLREPAEPVKRLRRLPSRSSGAVPWVRQPGGPPRPAGALVARSNELLDLPVKERAPLPLSRRGAREIRQRPTLPHGFPCSTIGDEGLNFRVRDGNGWCPLSKAAGNLAGSTRDP